MVKKNACVFISGKGTNLKNLIFKPREYNFPINIKLVVTNKKNVIIMNLIKLNIKYLTFYGFSNENYHSFNDRKEALEFALKNLKTDEILIIFGKGTEEYQEINGTKHFYSDCDIIKEFYEN